MKNIFIYFLVLSTADAMGNVNVENKSDDWFKFHVEKEKFNEFERIIFIHFFWWNSKNLTIKVDNR